MTIKIKVRLVNFAVTFAALLAMSNLSFAQDVRATPKVVSTNETSVLRGEVTVGEEKPKQLLNADLDDDGIIDAVESLISVRTSGVYSSNASARFVSTKNDLAAVLQKDLTAGFRAADLAKRKQPSGFNACSHYMMLAPQQQMRMDQKVQTVTLGQFGTRPCDPFVSTELERPIDDTFIVIPILPGVSYILHD